MTNLPFLQTIARYGKPIILATGMSTLPEIKEALQTIHNVGNRKVIALHCTTNYPCPLNEVNLKAMKTMQEELDCLIGYSDHTMGLQVPIMAASLGAVCIEKHFTLDKSMKGPDHAASLEPDELREMVTSIRNIHSIHGIPEKKPNNSEQSMIRMIRKSIVAKNDFPEGSIVTKEAITIKRPGTGLPPKYFSWLIGKRLVKPLLKDQLLRWEHIGETQNSKKIVWLSANKLGQELLSETVKQGIEISAIITLNPKAKTVMYDGIDVGKWNEFGIPVYEIEDINCEKELLSQLTPDLVMMCGWRQVINKEILSFPSDGFIGFHPTLLPIGRGPAPIINSVISNFTKSGLTLFHVSEGLDDGDIIGQEHFTIEKNDHAQDIYDKVIEAGKKLVVQYFPLIALGKAQRIPQSENNVLVFEKPSLECNRIDFEKESIEQIYNKIRALSKPYKGAYIERNGKKLRIWRAELEDSS